VSPRRGFALVAALWLLVAVTTAAAATLALAREGTRRSAARITLRRAEWARDACVAILLARFDLANPRRGVDSTDLGRGSWCRATVTAPSDRLDVNRADRSQLARLLHADSLVDALLDWRDADDEPREHGVEAGWYRERRRAAPRNGPLVAVEEMVHVRGFERLPVESLAARFTTQGDGRVDIASAPLAVVAATGWLDETDLLIVGSARRELGAELTVEEVVRRLGRSRQAALSPRYPELVGAFVSGPPLLIATIEGRVGHSRLVATARLALVPSHDRLTMVRREVW
jgi:type II secretory pathway component PulK